MNKELRFRLSMKHVFSILFAFLGIMMAFTEPITVEASVYNTPKLKVVSEDPNYTVGQEHVFIPVFNNGQSEAKPFGGGFVSQEYQPGEGQNVYALQIGGSNHATIRQRIYQKQYGMRYTNVGYYKGQSMDLVATIVGLSYYGTPGTQNDGYGSQGYLLRPVSSIAFQRYTIGLSTQGLNHVDVEYTTIPSGSSLARTSNGGFVNAVNTSGYYTFHDIDVHQRMGFPNSTWGKINQVLIEDRTSKLGYKYEDSHYTYHYDYHHDVARTYNKQHAVTVLYKNTDTFRFRWGRDSNRRRADDPWGNMNPNRPHYPIHFARGDLMMYTSHKPAPTKIPDPTKKQSQSYGLKHNEIMTYNIEQEIPFETSAYWFSNFVIQDELNDAYSVVSAKVFDMHNNDVSSRFNITTGKMVKATAKSPSSAGFYSNKYRLEIQARLNGNIVVNNMGNNTHYDINNWGRSIGHRHRHFDRWTNKVSSRIERRTIRAIHLNEYGEKIHADDVQYAIDGMPYNLAPRNNLRNDLDHAYRHIETIGHNPSGTVNGDVEVTFIYDEPRPITVEHRTHVGLDMDILLNKDNEEIIWEYDGIELTVSARENYFVDDENYFYRPHRPTPDSPITQTIIVDGPHKLIFRYDTPRTITTRHYDKDDDRLIRTTYIKGIYDDQEFTTSPLWNSIQDVDGYFYRPIAGEEPITKLVNRDMEFEFIYERPRIIEILHRDIHTGNLIATDIYEHRIYDTDGYVIYSRPDEDLTYYHPPLGTTYYYYAMPQYNNEGHGRLTGTVIEARVDKERNVYTLKFNYRRPRDDIGPGYIRIDTDKVEDGLPMFVKYVHYDLIDNNPRNTDLTLTVYDRTNNVQVYQDTNVQVANLESGMSFVADASHRKKGSKAVYEAVVTTNEKEDLVSGYASNAKIHTNAYTASERVIKAESIKNDKVTVSFEGVAMTERHADEKKLLDIKEYNERVTATIDPSISIHSGYGYRFEEEVTFETEVSDHDVPEIVAKARAHKDIAEGDYDLEESRHIFDLDADSVVGNLSSKSTFQPPKVFVNRRDGDISVNNEGSRVDGGHKVYVPIWVNKLDTHSYNVQTNRLGRHQVMFDLDEHVTIEAYMFGHIDSETLNDDALLIEPAKTNMLDRWFKNRD